MSDIQEIIHKWEKTDPTKKVKLMKMSKGYQWEITYESTDNQALLKEIIELNTLLRNAFELAGNLNDEVIGKSMLL